MTPIPLAEAAPELAAWIDAGLVTPAAILIHRVSASSGHVSLDTNPDLDAFEMMDHPRRERIWIGRPRGVRRRQWGVSLEVIDDTVWHVGVSHPGILRESFARLAAKLG